MAEFDWVGTQSNGLRASGRLTADSPEQVVALLRAQGIQAESMRSTTTGTTGRAGGPDGRKARIILIAAFAIGMLLILAFPFLSVIF